MNLASLRRGSRARIVAVTEPGSLGERLLELGLTPGIEIRLVRRGPFGDPLQISVRGTMLSLRAAQAEGILVQPLDEVSAQHGAG